VRARALRGGAQRIWVSPGLEEVPDGYAPQARAADD
jgi:hypothetical protein